MNNIVFDHSKPVPNLTDEELNYFISYVTAVTPKQIESFKSKVIDDINSYKESEEWQDIETIINSQPLHTINLNIKSTKEDLCRMLTSEAAWLNKYCEEKPYFHSIAFENLSLAIIWKAKEDVDTYYRNKLRNRARKEAQGQVSYDQLKFIKNLNPDILYEDPDFEQQYKDKLKAKIESIITKYLDVLWRTVLHEEQAIEDNRQIGLLSEVLYFVHRGYDIRSVEGLYFLANIYRETKGVRRNDVYSLLLTMNSLEPEVETPLELMNAFINTNDENFYLAFDTKSYAANNTPYSDVRQDLTHVDSPEDNYLLYELGKQIKTEYKEFSKNEDFSVCLTRAIKRLATSKNQFKLPEKYSDAWNKVYGYVICKIDGAYKKIFLEHSEEIQNAPWCYYGALCDREESDRLIEPYDNELLVSFSQQFSNTGGKYRSLIYKAAYVLNYIKVMQGYSKTVIKDFDSSREDEDKMVVSIIKFLEPILNNDVINPRAFSIDGFIGLMKSILKDERIRTNFSTKINKTYRDKGIDFDLPTLYSILGTIAFKPKGEKEEKEHYSPYKIGEPGEQIIKCNTPIDLNWKLVEGRYNDNVKEKKNHSWKKQLVNNYLSESQRKIIYDKIIEIHKKDPFRHS